VPDVDAVVVGAGPNGLVAAVVLAEAGLRVVVLEAASRAGGALRTEELTLPGYRHDVGATVLPLALASPAFRALGLGGVAFSHPDIPLGHALAPGRSVLLHRSAAETAGALGRDGRRWQRVMGAPWQDIAVAALDPIAVPPRSARGLLRLGAHGAWPATWAMRGAFREEPARALFAGLAAHAELPLRAWLTSAYAITLGALGHGVGWPVVTGGSERLAEALVARLEALGGEVRTGHRVGALAELPSARVTLLDVGARQLRSIAGERLPAGVRRRLERWRDGPGVFKLDWALDAPIPWADASLARAGTVHVGGTAADVVAAERAVAEGGVPAEPFVLLVQPTVADASRAPDGRHTAWAYCHVPNGWAGDATELIESRVETLAPGFRERVLARHAMGPAALEAWDANLVGGDIGGGAMDWRQLLGRARLTGRGWHPSTRSARSGSRGDGPSAPGGTLYLCSASTLPGGGAHGMGGWHAARAALARL